MPYRLLDVDLRQPFADVALGPAESGLAVVARLDGRPVGFWMDAHAPGRTVPAAEVRQRAAAEVGVPVVRLAAEAELAGGAEPAPPSVTVAVCTHDRPERLGRCLRALVAVRAVGGRRPEVVVVDNAPSDDRTRATVAGFDGVRYVREPRVGLDFARNRALAEADGDWVAFLDDDVVPDAGWFGGLAGALAVHPDAGAVTGLVLPLELGTEAQVLFERDGGFRRGFRPVRYQGSTMPGNRLYPVGAGIFGAGANMAFRRRLVLDLGGFDEALDTGAPLPGGGDLDMFYRVVRSGAPLVYWPDAAVRHEHRRTLAALRRQYHSWGLGFMAFLDKTRRADPDQRPKVRGMVQWWFRHQARRYAAGLKGTGTLPASMVAAEVQGGVQGLGGEYGRSQARAEAVRQSAGGPALAPLVASS